MRDTRVPTGGIRPHVEPFHVVDLVSGLGFDQRGPVHSRARADVGGSDAADAHPDSLRQRILPLRTSNRHRQKSASLTS